MSPGPACAFSTSASRSTTSFAHRSADLKGYGARLMGDLATTGSDPKQDRTENFAAVARHAAAPPYPPSHSTHGRTPPLARNSRCPAGTNEIRPPGCYPQWSNDTIRDSPAYSVAPGELCARARWRTRGRDARRRSPGVPRGGTRSESSAPSTPRLRSGGFGLPNPAVRRGERRGVLVLGALRASVRTRVGEGVHRRIRECLRRRRARPGRARLPARGRGRLQVRGGEAPRERPDRRSLLRRLSPSRLCAGGQTYLLAGQSLRPHRAQAHRLARCGARRGVRWRGRRCRRPVPRLRAQEEHRALAPRGADARTGPSSRSRADRGTHRPVPRIHERQRRPVAEGGVRRRTWR